VDNAESTLERCATGKTLPRLRRRHALHGFSSKEPFDRVEQYNILSDSFADLVHALGYEKVNYEGESMGAMTGFYVGFRYPELINKMVLNTGFYLLRTSKKDFQAESESRILETSHKTVLNRLRKCQNRLHCSSPRPTRITMRWSNCRKRLYEDPEINASMRKCSTSR